MITSRGSFGIFALATFESASSMPLSKVDARTDTMMRSPVTPRCVLPPLSPEKVMHGGE